MLGIMKDLFEGKRYDIIEPKEGDIVRINIHRESLGGIRNYILVIYPSEDNVRHINTNGRVSLDCLRFLGYAGYVSSGCIVTSMYAKKVVYVKPTINDIREFSQKLLERGERYNRKKKEITKANKNESNR